MLSRTSLRRRASRLDSGSSIKNSRGLRTIARAIATRCRWPPESFAGLRSSSASSCSICATLSTRGCQPLFFFLTHLHAEGDVVAHREMWKQRIVLEDHRKIAFARRGVGDVLIMQPDFAFTDLIQPGKQAQQGALPQPDGPTSTTNSPS